MLNIRHIYCSVVATIFCMVTLFPAQSQIRECVGPISPENSANIDRLFSYTAETVSHTYAVNKDSSLVAFSDGNLIYLLDIRGLDLIGPLVHPVNPPPEPGPEADSEYVYSLVFDPDGSVLYSGSSLTSYPNTEWGSLRAWNVLTMEQITLIDEGASIRNMSMSFDGTHLAYTRGFLSIRGVNLESGIVELDMPSSARFIHPMFSPTENTLAFLYDTGVELLDLESGNTLNVDDGMLNIAGYEFSPDGSMIAVWYDDSSYTGSDNDFINLWSTETGERINRLYREQDVTGIAFSSDGTHLAAGGIGGNPSVDVWRIDAPRPIRTLTGHADTIFAVAFSPDDTMLVSTSRDGSIRFWDVEEFEFVNAIFLADAMSSVEFLLDGTRLLLHSGNRIEVWGCS